MLRALVFLPLTFLFIACGTAGVTPEPGMYSGSLHLQTVASALRCSESEDSSGSPCCDEQISAQLAIANEGDDSHANQRRALRIGESIRWNELSDGVFFGCETQRWDRWSLLADGTTHLERLVNLNCALPQRTLVCRYQGALSSD